ncbi:male accessory gland serine protease inhibitor-like [Drosophila nasuta]|uniref:male accessory gland serine protease inhibitor-like n=1 Tax=Drosophila nasuta TaxID=42062 RepID=UPI00295ECBB2|nr:male accessory gland serine protease inhibitor-like [Drosophila nasuta]
MKFLAFFLVIVACAVNSLAYKNDVCGLPHSLNGDGRISCEAYIPSWSYDPQHNECVKFIYGGCGGNANRFATEQKCKDKCVV